MDNETQIATKHVEVAGTLAWAGGLVQHSADQLAITTKTHWQQEASTGFFLLAPAITIPASDDALLAEGYQEFADDDRAIAEGFFAAGAEQLPPA